MSDAELRRQGRYTWMLVIFTAVVMFFMFKQSRATAQTESARPAVTLNSGLMIDMGSHLR